MNAKTDSIGLFYIYPEGWKGKGGTCLKINRQNYYFGLTTEDAAWFCAARVCVCLALGLFGFILFGFPLVKL
jgi:hypothetical protein